MKTHPNWFSSLFYNGDWHTTLVEALKLGKEGTRSQEMLAAIEVLERQLAETDECVHTVTAVLAVPHGMDGQFLLTRVQQCVDVEPATLRLVPNGDIELTITARGNREHVVSMAETILECGLSSAKAKIWAGSVLLPK